MKQKIVGTYYLGYEQCDLVLVEGTGGNFQTCPEKSRLPLVEIGADHVIWGELVGVLIHEALELLIFRESCRFSQDDDMAKDHGGHLMVMDHRQFSNVSAKAGHFLVDCLPDVSGAWKAWNKAKKKKKK